jgi:hypothetical protein
MTVTGRASMARCSSYGGGKIETQLSGKESGQDYDNLFIVVEGESQAVRRWWLVAVVHIQCFNFSSRGEVTVRNVIGR